MKIELASQDDLVIVGTGTLAGYCIKWLRNRMSGKLFVFEDRQGDETILKKEISIIPNVVYETISTDIEKRILTMHPKFILSIGNSYIFRPQIIDCCPILNYHNALLPYHSGRNAEAWAIYEQDAVTGVTWHLVSERVDRGLIVQQKELALDSTITSIKLLKKQSELAFIMFQQIFQQIHQIGYLETRPQESRIGVKHHYSWERPNNGILDSAWPAEKISAFLRAMDYGNLYRLGIPRLQYKGRMLRWKRYSVKEVAIQPEYMELNGSILRICKANHTICLFGIQDITSEGARL